MVGSHVSCSPRVLILDPRLADSPACIATEDRRGSRLTVHCER